MSLTICVCECIKKSLNDEVNIHIFLDLVLRYTIDRKPITLNDCECNRCRPVNRIIFDFEFKNLINILEINPTQFCLVPRGYHVLENTEDEVLICICGGNNE